MSRRKREDYASRKFVLTAFIIGVGSLALLLGKMGGGEYVALATLVLGVYGTANVAEKKVSGTASDER